MFNMYVMLNSYLWHGRGIYSVWTWPIANGDYTETFGHFYGHKNDGFGVIGIPGHKQNSRQGRFSNLLAFRHTVGTFVEVISYLLADTKVQYVWTEKLQTDCL